MDQCASPGRVRRRWPESGSSCMNRTCAPQGSVGFFWGQQVLRRSWPRATRNDQETRVLEALFDLATASAQAQAAEALPVFCLPDQLASVSPSGAEPEPRATPADASVAVLADALLQGRSRHPSWHSAGKGTGRCGWPSSSLTMGEPGGHRTLLRGAPKPRGCAGSAPWLRSTGRAPCSKAHIFSQAPWRSMKSGSRRWGVGISCGGGSRLRSPLHVALLPSNATPSCALFPGAAQSPRVSPQGHHHRWLGRLGDGLLPGGFPTRSISCVASRPARRLSTTAGACAQVAQPADYGPTHSQRCFVPPRSARTAVYAYPPSRGTGQPGSSVVTRLLAKLPQLLPAVGSTWRPTTSNAARTVFGGLLIALYRGKGRSKTWPRPTSTWRSLCGACLRAFSAEAAAERQSRCPLQLAGYEVGPIPLFICAIDASLATPPGNRGGYDMAREPPAPAPPHLLLRAC